MSPLHKWMIPAAGLAVLALTLWGVYGMGTARKNLPERDRTPAAVTVSEIPEDGSSGDAVQKYNAALHRRSGPLVDPFHMEAIQEADGKRIISQSADNTGNHSSGPSGKQERVAARRGTVDKESSQPILKGILSYKGDRRAILEVHGSTNVVREGERAGVWTVSEIQEKTVVLSSASGTLSLVTH
ncbi:hypothetical protein [uncultured Dialister sp.]|jgi:hypothetical protein|uniref:hypothetical protein n=1 Tax=uncultured Dialister sp. TaxID=278064 RepID=UPI0025FCD9F4|nr:hypothetical protein [uncultured Dialister sp.]